MRRWLQIQACMAGLLLAASLLPGCKQTTTEEEPTLNPPLQSRTVRRDRHRARAAALTIRFSNSGIEPGSSALGHDRLQVAAVFADADRRDVHLVGDLVGLTSRRPQVQLEDTCVRQQGPFEPRAVRRHVVPHAWLQLLDVGNMSLTSGANTLPLRITMVPSLFSAIRGVRYDGDVDHARHLLAAGKLSLHATGGDGIAAFSATVDVPRPVRLTHVGSHPVRSGRARLPAEHGDLLLRWGSVDGTARMEVVIGAERGEGLDWLHCRLTDDGMFTVPVEALLALPKRSEKQPWLISLVRSRLAHVPGFPGQPLRLQLVDAVRAW